MNTVIEMAPAGKETSSREEQSSTGPIAILTLRDASGFGQMAQARSAGTSVASGNSVLIVEDEFLIREMLAVELRLLGWTVVEACRADEALEILEAGGAISLVVSDIRMPGKLDGLALVRIVQERYPEVRCVLTSGYAAPQASGFGCRFVHKPYVVDQIDAVLREEARKLRSN